MGRVGIVALGAVLALAGMAPAAAAQGGRRCRQVLPADARRLVNAQGEEVYYFMDPVRVLCTGGVRLEADSAVMNRTDATVLLVGDVVYRDSTRELTADWANYLGSREQLLARDDVVLRDLDGGTIITGGRMDYLRETADRPVARMIVEEGRPHAVIPRRTESPAADSAEPRDTAAAPTEVWANRMVFQGEDVFTGEGDVEIERGGTTGGGDRATFDQRTEEMTLVGSAHVENERYRLEGERIDAFLRGDALEEVRAREAARVVSAEMDVSAERIRIGFRDDRLERLEAWNPEPETTRRARANSEDFRLRADSIDAWADSLGIREVRAVGRAYGERAADSVVSGLPPVAVRDWIQGDTIIGYFAAAAPDSTAEPLAGADAPPAPAAVVGVEAADGSGRDDEGDATVGAEEEVVLERIVVIGGSGPALSLYRMRSGEEGASPSVNFMRAQRIILFMERGDVGRVEAEGPIEGVYLDPSGRRPGGRSGQGGETGR